MQITKETPFRYEILEISETAKARGIDNTLPPTLRQNAARLWVELIAPIVREFGPIVMTSGYRCQVLNDAVSGSRTSQHMQAQAMDFRLSTTDRSKMFTFFETAGAMPLPYHQFIIYDTFFHISITPLPVLLRQARRQKLDFRAKK